MPFRTIDTDIWSNAWFYDLTSAQKVMFIFLFSNPLVSNIGVLEISRRQLAATTGVSLSTANKFLEELEQDGRIVVDGKLILITDFISKQTHFGGASEVNKNDRLLKNLLQLFNACPSEKLKRGLQQEYPGLFRVTQDPCEDEISPLSEANKPLVSKQEAPCSAQTSPLSKQSKPLAQEEEGVGGDIRDIGDIGENIDPPLPPLQGGNDAAASDTCEHCEPHTDADTSAAQAVLSPEQPPKKPRTRKERKDELPLRPADWEAWYSKYPNHSAKQNGILAWNDAIHAGVLPDLAVLLDALDWQIPANRWSPAKDSYTPLPATYINQRRWRDERPPAQAQRPFPGTQAQPFFGGKLSDMERNAMNIQAACNVLARQAAKEGVPFPPTNFDTMNTQEVFVAEALPCGQENLR